MPWEESHPYQGGNKVIYGNQVYEARHWVKGTRPDASGAPYNLLDAHICR